MNLITFIKNLPEYLREIFFTLFYNQNYENNKIYNFENVVDDILNDDDILTDLNELVLEEQKEKTDDYNTILKNENKKLKNEIFNLNGYNKNLMTRIFVVKGKKLFVMGLA